jgi:putative membrane protein
MVREISGRIVAVVAWSAFVVLAIHFVDLQANGKHDESLRFLTIPLSAHSLLGVVLSLLLVFRTNSSYDRFWEGRKLWGGIVNETRNLARLACVHLHSANALKTQIVQLAIAFAYSSMHKLRQQSSLEPAAARLGPATEALAAAEHVPLAVATQITNVLTQARSQGLIDSYVLVQMDQNVQLLVDYLGGCERIHKTPLPFAYMVHLRRAIILYTLTLPFALYDDFGFATIAVTFLVAFFFFGIEEIGVTIEDPFEGEENDLPLEQICATIDRNLSALLHSNVALDESKPA